MKRLIKYLLSLFLNNLRVRKGTILIIESSYPSGSNTMLLYKKLKKKCNVDIIYKYEFKIKQRTIPEYLNYINLLIRVARYNYIICTDGFSKINENQILIDLWHGIPIKAMMYMELDSSVYRNEGFKTNFLITSSKLESSLMSACTHIPYVNHRILGSPRNDYLHNIRDNLGELDFIKNYNKVLLYVPTFRQGYLNRIEGKLSNNLFYFDEFISEEFINYLKHNNILLLIKYHPFEEEKKKNEYSLEDNIFYLSNKVLFSNVLDLYEVLPHTDLLITDYSSIYFDYLLLDKPIIFTPVDLENYRKLRGLLLEPYDLWTPGPKCINQNILQQEISKCINNRIYYKLERERIRNIFHKYQDGKSSERVIKFVEELMKE